MGMYSFVMGKVPYIGSPGSHIYGINGHDANDPSSGLAAGFTVMPFAGVCKGLRGVLDSNAATLSTDYTFTVYKNAVATTVTCSVGVGDFHASDTSHQFSFTAGDYLSLQGLKVPTETNSMLWNVIVESDTRNNSYIGGSATFLNTADTRYYAFCGQGANLGRSSTEANVSIRMANTGTLKNLVVRLNEAPGASKSYTFTVYKNGAPTALTGSITGASDLLLTVNATVSISVDDTLSLEIVPSGTPTGNDASWACTYSPTVDGEMTFGVVHNSPSSVATNNAAMDTYVNDWTGGVLNIQRQAFLTPTFTLKSFHNFLATAPGSGNTRQFITVGTDANVVQCTISDAETSCSYTTPYAITDADYVSKIGTLRTTPASTPDATALTKHTYVFFKQPRTRPGFFNFFEPSGGNNRELCN